MWTVTTTELVVNDFSILFFVIVWVFLHIYIYIYIYIVKMKYDMTKFGHTSAIPPTTLWSWPISPTESQEIMPTQDLGLCRDLVSGIWHGTWMVLRWFSRLESDKKRVCFAWNQDWQSWPVSDLLSKPIFQDMHIYAFSRLFSMYSSGALIFNCIDQSQRNRQKIYISNHNISKIYLTWANKQREQIIIIQVLEL